MKPPQTLFTLFTNHMNESSNKEALQKTVLDFYKVLPFNYYSSPEEEAQRIKEHNDVKNYYVLDPLINKQTRILEIGCGTGRLANSIAHHYKCDVTAIDFNEKALQHAKKTAAALGINTHYITADLFSFQPAHPAPDLVISIGVLHHTYDCAKAIRLICQKHIKRNGFFFLGLYHRYGRKPFLNYFNSAQKNGASEEKLFSMYKEIHKEITDELLLRSWFRDQVLHPHETQHTLLEVAQIAKEESLEIISTSINHFKKSNNLEDLFEIEKSYEELSKQRLKERKYFPGFFLCLLKKN